MPQQSSGNGDATQQVDSATKRLEKLRFAYEQYFMGVERIEPVQEKNSIKTMLNTLKKSHIRNTALRFRINQLTARLHSYDTYWNRVARQIEEGTYQRDILKARYRAQARSQQNSTESNTFADGQPQHFSTRHQPSQTGPGAVGDFSPKELTEQQINTIHEAYTNARLSCGESVNGLTKEVVANSLRKQIPNIMKQYGCKRVGFKVKVKNGKAVIRAVPKS